MANTVMMGPHHFDRSTLGFFAIAGLTFVAMIATTAVTMTLATTALTTSSIFALAIVASVFEILALATFLTTVALFLRRVSWGFMLSAWISGATCCTVGSILAIVTLASTLHYTTSESSSSNLNEEYVRRLAGAGLAPAVIQLIPQAAFFTMIWPRRDKNPMLPRDGVRSSPNSSTKRRSLVLHLASIGPNSSKTAFLAPTDPMSPSQSCFSSPQSSLRNSLSTGLRPMTSKTRLILGTSFSSRYSDNAGTSLREMRSTDEFEHWDTSRVDDNYAIPYAKKTKLETIPGSRPVSPAKPLNGPFPDGVDPEHSPLPDSAVASPASETGSIRNLHRPSIASIRRGSTPSIAGPISPAGDQSHIHPLFRTESPAPPPLASPRTVITASPYAGQVFDPDFALHSPRILGSRDGSRPSSPARFLSPDRSRSGSVKSFRTVPNSPIEAPVEPLPNRSLSQVSQSRKVVNRSVTPNG